ncbi:DNA repair protein [Aulographum hederae CBS 113979]|uniref:DNA repair protein RAD14 n=1 Tax=Aulographum hederae CBS 113979 TaxID=1176131 RepID=A0A6G1GRJ0_9PEZI|nr:DNA repair protein [Aulographum hederae CBS 113979]
MADRPSTPPRPSHSGNLPKSPMTPEQVRRMEEARLKAKAIRAKADAAAARNPPTSAVAGQKRPHSRISSSLPTTRRDATTNASPLKEGELSKPPADKDIIRPAKNLGKYIEYDFSKMTDTRGGFLSELDDPFNKALHSGDANDPKQEKPKGMTMQEWERHQLLQKLRKNKQGPFEPGISVLNKKLGPDDTSGTDKECRECGSLEIDWKWEEVFGIKVCNACKEKLPDKYSLLTKTEAREDYLLTDPELKDEELLPHLKKPNPHKSTWNDMQLYLRCQVEEYAFSAKKWGSGEALDAEFERRQTEAKRRKEKKFKSKLDELKKRTRVEAHKRARGGANGAIGGDGAGVTFGGKLGNAPGYAEKHEHEWGRPVLDPETGVEKKKCTECDMEIEELEF